MPEPVRARYTESVVPSSTSITLMKPTAIDLFSGAGGLSLGLLKSKFDVVGAIEWDADAVASHERFFGKRVKHFCGDVRDVDWSMFEGVDLVAGGPPCQPFSVSGKQRGSGDERDMVPEFVKAVGILRPRAFLMENVAGLASARFEAYLADAVAALEDLGYGVKWSVLDAADYGVPQHRTRLFVVGLREGRFEFPEPTHGPGRDRPWVTVRQALDGAPEDSPNTARVVYATRPVLRRSAFAGMLLNGKGRPLRMDAPSLTIPASAGGNRTHILDPEEVLVKYHAHLMAGGAPRKGDVPGCRRLTVRESARLQSFPDDFVFCGKKSKQYTQVGNAVPPTLAAAVASQVRIALEQGDDDAASLPATSATGEHSRRQSPR